MFKAKKRVRKVTPELIKRLREQGYDVRHLGITGLPRSHPEVDVLAEDD